MNKNLPRVSATSEYGFKRILIAASAVMIAIIFMLGAAPIATAQSKGGG